MSTFKANFYLDDVCLEVEANFIPGEPQTYWEPGCPDEVEPIRMSIDDTPLADNQMNFIIESYGEKEFYEWLLEQAYEHVKSEQEYHAEYLYEQHKDRIMEGI